MKFGTPSRRRLLKAIGGAAVVANTPGVGAAKSRERKTTRSPESPFDFEYKTVGSDVRDAVGHRWWLLSVDRDRLDELLEASADGPRATREKGEAIDELRSTYEVELERNERDERELTYHLVDSSVRPLHESDVGTRSLDSSQSGKEAADSVFESVSAGLRREASQSIEPMHSGSIHEKMAVAAVEGTEHDSDWILDDLKDGSTDPDQWGQKCRVCSKDWMSLGDRFDWVDISPDVVEEKVREAIRAIDDSASPHHMYVPGGEEFEVHPLLSIILPPQISLLEVEVEGAAPRDAQQHWQWAQSYSGSSDFIQAGRALHFLQDMSHPLHTGAIGEQVLGTQGTVHSAYRDYIDNNWEDGNNELYDFRVSFQEVMNSPTWEGSMEDACKEMAKTSSQYSETVYETIVENGPNNPGDWDFMVEGSAHSCMCILGAYSRGAINQM